VRRERGVFKAVPVSRDHSPYEQDEYDRILAHGGRIFASHEDGPLRVWLAEEEKPGLAMTRCLGDRGAREVGVVADPEFHHLRLSTEDKFIVIGSDGLFDYFPIDEIATFLADFWERKSANAAVEALVGEARRRWLEDD
jgi:serine/threonine protein phosphatase PrpC